MANPNQVIDETAHRYGKLTVIGRGPDQLQTDGRRKARWWCRCDCGSESVLVLGKLLRNGKTKSCGCLYAEVARVRITNGAKGYKPPSRRLGNAPDETGNTYGLLTVVKRGPDKRFPSGGRHAQWYCKCACGKPELVLRTGNWLRTARIVRSCGCQHAANRSVAFEAKSPLEARENLHKQRLAFFGKVELVGRYCGDAVKTEYRCLLHHEIHRAIPTNTARGRGLPCCKKAMGGDGLTAILDGTFRAASRECWLYLFRMARFPGLIKLGIASFMAIRPDDEYGELIQDWRFDSRVDASLVEDALKEVTRNAAYVPKQLKRWAGRTEIRRLAEPVLVEQAQSLVTAFHSLGRWQFALQHVPMSRRHRQQVIAQASG